MEHPYRTAVDVTVRRNLVYDFRSLLARDSKGRVTAGLYFPLMRNVNASQFTMFYDGPNGQSVKHKLYFNILKNAKVSFFFIEKVFIVKKKLLLDSG